jgi:hypothetical protein
LERRVFTIAVTADCAVLACDKWIIRDWAFLRFEQRSERLMVADMRRFFISPHPTFGSYSNPKPYLVEASPYYWWWYALTLNADYQSLCEDAEDFFKQKNLNRETEQKIRSVYADFGDVRYSGDRYVAFAKWWAENFNATETRAIYLFAEPDLPSNIELIENVADAELAIADEDCILIKVPNHLRRAYTDKVLDKILKKHLKVTKGRAGRDLKNSQARYCLSKPVVPSALKKTFDIYDQKILAAKNGENISNIEIANRAKLKIENKKSEDQVYDKADVNRLLSTEVSRKIKTANSMIDSTLYGVFP